MKYNNIEKELSNFTFKEPEDNLRDKVLLKAKSAWTEKYRAPVFTFRLLRNYAYGLAMLLLISIVSSKIDISLTDKLIGGKTILVAKTIEKNNGIGSLCSDLGIDCKNYKLLATMAKIEEDENKSNIFNQRDKLMEELNLTNGGLS